MSSWLATTPPRRCAARRSSVWSCSPWKRRRRRRCRRAAPGASRCCCSARSCWRCSKPGLHLNEALATLLAKERHAASAALLRGIVSELSKGRNFSDVLADHPQQFPVVYVATVRAAERTGDLPEALARFIAYQLQFDTIRKKLVSAAHLSGHAAGRRRGW